MRRFGLFSCRKLGLRHKGIGGAVGSQTGCLGGCLSSFTLCGSDTGDTLAARCIGCLGLGFVVGLGFCRHLHCTHPSKAPTAQGLVEEFVFQSVWG